MGDRNQSAASSRIYAFHVATAPGRAREFRVIVQAELFRPVGLKLSDAPGICSERFSQEFRGEAEDSRAEARRFVGDRTIKKCLGQILPQIEHDTEGISLTRNSRYRSRSPRTAPQFGGQKRCGKQAFRRQSTASRHR